MRARDSTITEVDIRNSVKVVAWNPEKLKTVEAVGEGIGNRLLFSKGFLKLT